MAATYRIRFILSAAALCCAAVAAGPALAQKKSLVYARDGSGVFGYKHTPIQPWSGYHVHDPDRPAPVRVTPGEPGGGGRPGAAPSDALVLFKGGDLSRWHPSRWKIEDGVLLATRGYLTTREEFGDFQLHVEWQAPLEREPDKMNQGNNGIQILRSMEVQIFDSYTTKIYPDGQAAAIYAQTPPLVNACRKPGEWQTYDILFTAPRFDPAGKLVEPARITMLHNGVVVHLHQEIYGHSPHGGLASYKSIQPRGPISLMAHDCPVRFRNIWIRPLKEQKKGKGS